MGISKCGVYLWTQKSTGLKYIGQSIDVFNRIQQHLASIQDPNALTKWCKALKTNDINDFKCEIIEFCTKDKLDEREAYWINHFDTYYNGFNSTKGNHRSINSIKKDLSNAKNQIMLPVLNSIEKSIDNIVKYYKNKKILIIGTFGSTLINNLISKNNSIRYIENDLTDINYWKSDKLIRDYIIPQNEYLLRKLEEMNEEKFDLVIANPPYSIGNKAINNVMHITDKAIVLMPLSKYKTNDLYRKVVDLQITDPKEFEDATITDNLCISILDNNHNSEESWNEFAINSYDQKYVEFYRLNVKKPFIHDFKELPPVSLLSAKIHKPYDEVFKNQGRDMFTDINSHIFIIGHRVCQDGVHSTENCLDYRYNILNQLDVFNNSGCQRIIFNSSKEKINFCKWWYNNPLQNELIKGLNKTGGSPIPAIPHIDYSKDRDYEHLTYEDLCYILENED